MIPARASENFNLNLQSHLRLWFRTYFLFFCCVFMFLFFVHCLWWLATAAAGGYLPPHFDDATWHKTLVPNSTNEIVLNSIENITYLYCFECAKRNGHIRYMVIFVTLHANLETLWFNKLLKVAELIVGPLNESTAGHTFKCRNHYNKNHVLLAYTENFL